ncbi:hypothetical protein IV88_GL000591 [Pediococcus argentinicus]|uniref:Uncharacterized protein n=1 Tax=Pediococcus argentinicus TaxID=480391 RepID=A0A0R2NQG2_9LACO|nr:hypothetical protein IV88_GL000591 [Pediococcus argentinicus]
MMGTMIINRKNSGRNSNDLKKEVNDSATPTAIRMKASGILDINGLIMLVNMTPTSKTATV